MLAITCTCVIMNHSNADNYNQIDMKVVACFVLPLVLLTFADWVSI